MLFREIGILFAGMPISAIICLIVGLIFLLIEIFQPGFGVFGIIGTILSIVGIILRVLVGDGSVVGQIFLLLFFQMIIIAIAFLIMYSASKRGWLVRSPLIERGTAVSQIYSDGTQNFANLVGKLGVAITDLRPIGRVNIDGALYDASADGFFIAKGESVKVVSVEGTKILVECSVNTVEKINS